jgi:hypothetical protein
MKTFYGAYIYRGANFIIKFCAKSIKDAANLIDTTPYQIATYYTVAFKDDFEGIIAEPYGSRTVIDYKFGKEEIHFSNLKHLKETVDEKVDRYYKHR